MHFHTEDVACVSVECGVVAGGRSRDVEQIANNLELTVIVIVLEQGVEDAAAVAVQRWGATYCLRYVTLLVRKESRDCSEVEMDG